LKPWYTYIVECSDGSLYTGVTTDIQRRINEHNKGIGAKYTMRKRPVIVRAFFIFKNRSEASKEEWRIKQLTRKQKLNLIQENDGIQKVLQSRS